MGSQLGIHQNLGLSPLGTVPETVLGHLLIYATFCQEERILLQKYRNRNGRCVAILFKSIGVRGRFHSHATCLAKCQQDFETDKGLKFFGAFCVAVRPVFHVEFHLGVEMNASTFVFHLHMCPPKINTEQMGSDARGLDAFNWILLFNGVLREHVILRDSNRL